jgi:type I restriction enzyme R subunit
VQHRRNASARQIEFIDLVIEHLTEKGTMDPRLLYESPFTDVASTGPEEVFELARVRRLVETIEWLNDSAIA